jgi:hypothetical protein
VAPLPGAALPGSQGAQALAPSAAAKRPGAQLLQALWLPAL